MGKKLRSKAQKNAKRAAKKRSRNAKAAGPANAPAAPDAATAASTAKTATTATTTTDTAATAEGSASSDSETDLEDILEGRGRGGGGAASSSTRRNICYSSEESYYEYSDEDAEGSSEGEEEGPGDVEMEDGGQVEVEVGKNKDVEMKDQEKIPVSSKLHLNTFEYDSGRRFLTPKSRKTLMSLPPSSDNAATFFTNLMSGPSTPTHSHGVRQDSLPLTAPSPVPGLFDEAKLKFHNQLEKLKEEKQSSENSLNHQIEQADQEINSLKAQLESQGQDTKKLKEAEKSARERNSKLETDLHDQNLEMRRLAGSSDSYRAEVKKIREIVSKLQSEFRELSSKLSSTEKDFYNTKIERDELKIKNDEVAAVLADEKERSERLQEQCNNNGKQLETINTELDRLRGQLASTNDYNRSLTQQKRHLETELTEKNKEIKDIRSTAHPLVELPRQLEPTAGFAPKNLEAELQGLHFESPESASFDDPHDDSTFSDDEKETDASLIPPHEVPLPLDSSPQLSFSGIFTTHNIIPIAEPETVHNSPPLRSLHEIISKNFDTPAKRPTASVGCGPGPLAEAAHQPTPPAGPEIQVIREQVPVIEYRDKTRILAPFNPKWLLDHHPLFFLLLVTISLAVVADYVHLFLARSAWTTANQLTRQSVVALRGATYSRAHTGPASVYGEWGNWFTDLSGGLVGHLLGRDALAHWQWNLERWLELDKGMLG